MAKSDPHWMEKAFSSAKHGALRATAKKMHLISGGEALSAHDLMTLARSKSPTTRKRAALAKAGEEARH